MHLLVQHVKDTEAPAYYLTRKLQAFTGASPLLAQTMAFDWLADLRSGRVHIPLALPEATPSYSRLHLRYALSLAHERSPLIEGEAWDDDSAALSYLTEDYAGHPAGTVALQVRTSHAAFVFLFLGSYYRDGTIHRYRHTPDRLAGEDVPTAPSAYAPPAPPAFVAVPALAVPWGVIGGALAKGIVSGLGSQIGTALFNAVFGGIAGGVPTWFGEVYKEFTRIVGQAFDDQWMRELEADMDALASMIKQYNLAKERFMLETAWADATRLTNRLMKFGETAVANFTVGGGLHLLVLQQLALTSADQEGYLALIRQQAKEYADWALAQRQTLYDDRLAMITGVREAWDPFGKKFIYSWCDYGLEGKPCYYDQNACGHDARAILQKQRDQHYADVSAYTKKELSPIDTIAAEWKKLEHHPLPPPP